LTAADDTVRAFLAVALPEPVRDALAAWVAAEREAPWARAVRWVRRESLHLTLRFLGEIAPARLEAVRDAAARVAADHADCVVPFVEVGPFPSARRPRVVAARLADVPELLALAADLEDAVVACGLAPESRRFHPHVTLGRVRGRLAGRMPASGDVRVDPLPVGEVVLLRSELTREGARYTALDRFALRGAARSPAGEEV
jgi:2'-5' RNA ligase